MKITRVTSLAEVWIETLMRITDCVYGLSLPLRKCGLKLLLPGGFYRGFGHFPCGSVDWNRADPTCFQCILGHFPCGSVDWNRRSCCRYCTAHVTSLAEVWIETIKPLLCVRIAAVTSLAEVWIETHSWIPMPQHAGRHFPCGSVDWNIIILVRPVTVVGHFPCGSVDWNNPWNEHHWLKKVTSLAEVWIETTSFFESMKLFL